MATARCFPSLPLSSRLLHLHSLLPISQSRLTLTLCTLVNAGFVNSNRRYGLLCGSSLAFGQCMLCPCIHSELHNFGNLETWFPNIYPSPPLRHRAPSTRKDTQEIWGKTLNIPPPCLRSPVSKQVCT